MDLGKDVQGGYSGTLRELSQDAQAEILRISDDIFSGFDGSNMEELLAEFIRRGYDEVIVPFSMASAQAGAAMVAYTTDGEAEAEPEIPPFEQFESQARYYATKIDWQEGDVSKFTEGMRRAADRVVSHSADNTTLGARRRGEGDVRFARVPVGPTCGFCVMLASRGFVYKSMEDAGFAGLLAFNRFHDHCDCRVYAETDGLSIEDYDPDAYYDRYRLCRSAVDYRYERNGEVYSAIELAYDAKDIAYKENHDFNEFVMSMIVSEMDMRDREWLYSGAVPMVGYNDGDVEAKKKGSKDHEAELSTAERLSAIGLRCVFKEDEVRLPDGTNKGLADLVGGIEIKTLNGCSSENTVLAHLKNASRKEDARVCVFDNTGNEGMDLETLADVIRRSRRFASGSVYVLDGETFIKIR